MQINPVAAGGIGTGQSRVEAGTGDKSQKLAEQSRNREIPGGEKPPSEREVIRAIEHANRSLEGTFTRFEFSIHEETHEILVKVFDRESGELIREIPPERLLDIVAKLWELAGIMVDERI